MKLITALRRRADLSVAQFDRHWHRVHAEATFAAVPSMTRYVQSPAVEHPALPRPFDGLEEIWMPDPRDHPRVAATLGTATDPAIAETLVSGEQRFIANKRWALCEERVVVPRPDQAALSSQAPEWHGVKMLALVFRRPELPYGQFAERWERLADTMLQVPGVLGYIQNLVIDDPRFASDFDGVGEVWYEDPSTDPDVEAALQTGGQDPAAAAAAEAVLQQESAFVDHIEWILARERVVVGPRTDPR